MYTHKHTHTPHTHTHTCTHTCVCVCMCLCMCVNLQAQEDKNTIDDYAKSSSLINGHLIKKLATDPTYAFGAYGAAEAQASSQKSAYSRSQSKSTTA